MSCVYEADGTFTKDSAGSLGAARELYRTLLELEQLPVLTEPGKQADLQKLREAYAARKKEERCLDRADLFALAIREAAALPHLRIVTLPTLRFTAQERALLDALSGGGCELVPLSAPTGFALPHLPTEGLNYANPLTLRNPGNTRIENCMGVDVEMDRVFRDILEKGYPLDSCAVAFCSGSYAPLVYEAAGRWGLPVSMSSGIPYEQTRLSGALHLLSDLRRRFSTRSCCAGC